VEQDSVDAFAFVLYQLNAQWRFCPNLKIRFGFQADAVKRKSLKVA
jgi:hypothetical protein